MDSLFFFFSKVLPLFIFPFPFFFLLGLFFLIKAHGFKQKFYIFLMLAFLGLFSSSFFANFLIGTLETDYPPIAIESLPASDVVVVLGGMISTSSSVPGRPELSASSDRLVDAIIIYKAKKAKKILFSGGSGSLFSQKYREADLAKNIIIGLGVPKEDIILERESRNTYENAVESAKLIKQYNFKSIILVTSALHFKRTAGCFRKQDLSFVAFPTDYKASSSNEASFESWVPSAERIDISTMAIKEWIGLFVYEFKGFL